MSEEATECSGFEALYLAALDSDVNVITGVPGYPITSLMELFLKHGAASKADHSEADRNEAVYNARWLTNEKVALEIALGASVSGKRSLVIVKHVGMNLLSDPLITSVTHTIGAGLVVLAGDDPGVKGSQNEQDSRWYGRIAETAVFDPTCPDAAYGALRRAYELSEETKTPVILRVTAGLEKSREKIRRFPPASGSHPEFDRSIWEIRMVEKHQRFHKEVYPLLEEEAENTELNLLKAGEIRNPKSPGAIGVISSGFASSLVEEVLESNREKYPAVSHSTSNSTSNSTSHPVSHLSLNLVNPLPLRKIEAFLKGHHRVLVVEESEPFIEEQVRIAGNVCGKKTGHIPYGQVRPEDIEFALEHIGEERAAKPADSVHPEALKKGRTSICDDCPYLPLYRLLRELDVRVAGDMGCSIRSAPEPLAAVNVSFALGSAISVACGFEKKGIAVIGDFALAHSGILGLLTAVHSGYEVLVLVLQNEVAAMTGGQEVPDLKEVVQAIVPDVSVFDIDREAGRREGKTVSEKENEIPASGLSDLIAQKLACPEVSVIFVKGKCRRY
ncbi:indolepyruvate ferredoxin oxidoreductase subunit alpha [Methanosarcina sp. KYL-1]|uniref:thiamine pyrophosphate-dependent enzyme n=1 Tax=Methanosarcina sp. KYL-1 TaxID=2602068 RepID=UPI002100F2A8